MNDCQKIQEMISAMLDGELKASEHEVIEEHVALCPECAAMYADFAALSGIFAESREEVPATLHSRIMKGVRTSRKPKKPLIIQLRPYMSAAACLVILIGAVFTLRDDRKSADSLATPMVAEAPAAPAAYAEDASPAEAAQNESFSVYINDESEKMLAEPAEAPLPAPAAPAAPAEPAVPAEPAAPAEPFWEYEPYGVYSSGTEIDEAFCITDSFSGYLPAAALQNALMDSGNACDMTVLPDRANAWLGLSCGSETIDLRLYFVGSDVYVETADAFYIAAGTVEEFLGIIG